MARALIINDKDNVAVVLEDVAEGDAVTAASRQKSTSLVARQAIPFGHKVALEGIPAGASVYKYGEVIGKASHSIEAGEHVHIHNIEGNRGRGDLQASTGR